MTNSKNLGTAAIHAGEYRIGGAVTMPIFQCATFVYEGADSYDEVRYARLNNTPSHLSLIDKLVAISGAEAGLVTSSGMAAIMCALTGLFGAGDHILMQRDIYGGTFSAATADLPRFGIEVSFLPQDPTRWADALQANTKAVYFETISNPTMAVIDLSAAAQFAKDHRLISLIDNTFASPVNFRPAEHGFDIVLHSATKYLNGHSDVVAGAILGRKDLIARLSGRLNVFGATLDPHACFLLQRGLKTLALRVERQNQNALALAEFLAQDPRVNRVAYPGLTSDPNHTHAQVFDAYGGMLAFEARSPTLAEAFCKSVRIAVEAPSLGGIETLVTRPATTSHVAMSSEERLNVGISDCMVRVSTGVEHIHDLLADFDAALG